MEISYDFILKWIIIPFLIFFGRIADVSIGTLRIIIVSRGIKFLASLLGFFEILVWLVVVSQILQNLTNPIYFIAYAGGFASGNYVGIWIEHKLSIGKVLLRIITSRGTNKFKLFLLSQELRYTTVEARSEKGDVEVLLCVVSRKRLNDVLSVLKRYNPNAFYTIEDIRQVNDSNYPVESRRLNAGKMFSRRRIFSVSKRK